MPRTVARALAQRNAGQAERAPARGPPRDVLGILEPDREAEQAGRDPVALPAVTRLELRARRRPGSSRSRSTAPRARPAPRPSPSRRRRRRGTRSPGSGRLDRRMRRRGARRGRAPSPPGARAERRGSASPRWTSQAVSARRDDPGEPARHVEPVAQLGVARDGDAGEHVVVPGEDLRRRVERDVAAVLERPEPERRGDRRVADDRRGVGGRRLEVGHRQQRVRGRLDEDQVGPVGRRPGLVELDDVDAPRRKVVEEHAVAVVGALGERDRALPAASIVSTTVVTAPIPDG